MENLKFDVVQTLLLMVNVNFVIIGISLLFTRKGYATANTILAVFLLLLAWVNTHYVFHYTKQSFLHFPNLIGTHMPFLFALPPLLYTYFRMVFNSNFRMRPAYWLHFLPAILITLYYLPLYTSSLDYKIHFINTGECYVNSFLFSILFFVHFIAYLVLLSYYVWLQHRKIKSKKISGLLQYTTGVLIISILIISLLIIVVALHVPFLYASLITSILYTFIIYQVFFRPEVFFSLRLMGGVSTNIKYADSSLSKEEMYAITNLLDDFLKSGKAFLNEQLTISEVAKELNISPHHLSQSINRNKKLNFNDLINRYRVDYALTIIENPDYSHFTMEAIGNMAGFGTRQTFINAFKKIYNYPPSQYLKLNQNTSQLKQAQAG